MRTTRSTYFLAHAGRAFLHLLLALTALQPLLPTNGETTNSDVAEADVVRITDGNSYSSANYRPNPMYGDEVILCNYGNWTSAGMTRANTYMQYYSGLVIGDSLWLPPYGMGSLTQISLLGSGAMRNHHNWPTDYSQSYTPFATCVYDGSHLWLIPCSSHQLVRVNVTDGSMTGYANKNGYRDYQGATADDFGYLWLTPSADNGRNRGVRRVQIDKASEMIDFTNGPDGFPWGGNHWYTESLLRGAAFDGVFHWMFPDNGDWLLGVNTSDPSLPMTGFDIQTWKNSSSGSSVNIGTNHHFRTGLSIRPGILYLIPNRADSIVRLDTRTGLIEAFKNYPKGFNHVLRNPDFLFASAIFDGLYIWLCPYGHRMVIRLDVETSMMTGFTITPAALPGFSQYPTGGNALQGMSFNPLTKSLYFIPMNVEMLVRLTMNLTGYIPPTPLPPSPEPPQQSQTQAASSSPSGSRSTHSSPDSGSPPPLIYRDGTGTDNNVWLTIGVVAASVILMIIFLLAVLKAGPSRGRSAGERASESGATATLEHRLLEEAEKRRTQGKEVAALRGVVVNLKARVEAGDGFHVEPVPEPRILEDGDASFQPDSSATTEIRSEYPETVGSFDQGVQSGGAVLSSTMQERFE